ncbi:MAG TPA: hypothetical protein VNM39_02395 [Verrucomicrobiae bacterium]|jgi:hypothetical protein|nr:hypothetical protein [Verrucomicrobiae bacterium]
MGTKKWYNTFITVDRPEPSAPAPADPARAVAEIAASIAPDTQFTSHVSDPNAFDQIYAAAEISSPPGGYTILKVADMLQSDHIRTAPPEMRKNSILLALDAAAVPLKSVIEDAIRRDRALDTYERVQQKAFEDLVAKKTAETKDIEAEIERLTKERQARIQANAEAVAKERARVDDWRLQKQKEEQRIADAVSYFVTENPITTTLSPGTGGSSTDPGTRDTKR